MVVLRINFGSCVEMALMKKGKFVIAEQWKHARRVAVHHMDLKQDNLVPYEARPMSAVPVEVL